MKKLGILIFYIVFSIIIYSKENILIISSYHKNFEWSKDLEKGIYTYFNDKNYDVEFFVEYMDSKRFLKKESINFFKDYLKDKYKDKNFSLVITLDDNALEFALDNNNEILKNKDLIYAGVNNIKNKKFLDKTNYTGIVEKINVEDNIKLIKKLHKDLKTINIIIDNTPTGEAQFTEFLKIHNREDINYNRISIDSESFFKKNLKLLNKQDVILFFSFNRYQNLDYISNMQGINLIKEYAKDIPVYTFWEHTIRYGFTGGYVISGVEHGKKTAETAEKILFKSYKISEIPILEDFPKKVTFNYNEVVKFKLKISSLKNLVLLNKKENFFEKNFESIFIISILFTLLIILYYNIINRKKGEQEIIKAQKEAENANRAKSIFLANMSHEIRTPLNGIIGMAEVLSMTKLNLDQMEYLKYIKNSSNNLLAIVNDILDISKIESGHIELKEEKIIIQDFMNEIIDIYKLEAKKKNIELLLNTSIKLPSIFIADKTKLRQILLNLLSNAVKFTHNGYIYVETDFFEKENNYFILFTVKDTGIGIEKSKINDIFMPFIQADEGYTKKYQGTGLGLSISKKLVNVMGGEIYCKSKKDEGSEFTFTIKVKKIEDLKENLIHTYRAGFINNSEIYSKELISILSKEDIKLDLFKNEDLLYKSNLKNYNFIILDYSFSENSMEIFKKLKEINKKIPIIVLFTSDDFRQNLTEVYRINLKHYLIKPINQIDLINKVQEIINKNKIENKNEDSDNSSNKKILVVEDNPINLETLNIFLSKKGFDVLLAENGKEGVEIFTTEHPDLVFMDIQMPIMNGFEAVEKIRKINKKVPIIAITAYAMKTDKERCLQAGMNDYIPKPVSFDTINEIIEKYI